MAAAGGVGWGALAWPALALVGVVDRAGADRGLGRRGPGRGGGRAGGACSRRWCVGCGRRGGRARTSGSCRGRGVASGGVGGLAAAGRRSLGRAACSVESSARRRTFEWKQGRGVASTSRVVRRWHDPRLMDALTQRWDVDAAGPGPARAVGRGSRYCCAEAAGRGRGALGPLRAAHPVGAGHRPGDGRPAGRNPTGLAHRRRRPRCPGGCPTPRGAVVLGRGEDATEVVADPAAPWHLAIQGATRSGKSALSYTFLGALAARPDVLVCGVDPSGILLAPWLPGRGGAWIATGTADLTGAVTALSGVVAEMDTPDNGAGRRRAGQDRGLRRVVSAAAGGAGGIPRHPGRRPRPGRGRRPPGQGPDRPPDRAPGRAAGEGGRQGRGPAGRAGAAHVGQGGRHRRPVQLRPPGHAAGRQRRRGDDAARRPGRTRLRRAGSPVPARDGPGRRTRPAAAALARRPDRLPDLPDAGRDRDRRHQHHPRRVPRPSTGCRGCWSAPRRRHGRRAGRVVSGSRAPRASPASATRARGDDAGDAA